MLKRKEVNAVRQEYKETIGRDFGHVFKVFEDGFLKVSRRFREKKFVEDFLKKVPEEGFLKKLLEKRFLENILHNFRTEGLRGQFQSCKSYRRLEHI